MRIIKTWRQSPPQANFFWGYFRGISRRKREFCLKINLRRAQIWTSEKNIIIKARRRRNFFENNKNLEKFWPEKSRIIKTYENFRSPKILKGGVLIINTPVQSVREQMGIRTNRTFGENWLAIYSRTNGNSNK